MPVAEPDLRELAALLIDAVDAGAAVSFISPLTRESAESWWRQALASSGAVCLVVRDTEGIAGTVQLHPAWAPNQPHRAEVTKLLVHRRVWRQGIGRSLMEAVEQTAREAGFTLLTLDAKRGAAADYLYRTLEWTAAGTIPGFAIDPDGTPHDAVIFYKAFDA